MKNIFKKTGLKFALIVFGIILTLLLDFLLGMIPGLDISEAESDPFVGFSRSVPVFEGYRAENGTERLRTAYEKQRWFNRQDFSRCKLPGTFRIITLGGSTTYGRPYRHETSFSAWLEKVLDQTCDQRQYEVINAGAISYASYRVKIVLEEILAFDPDLVVIYTGHNEFLEQRTYPKLLNTSPFIFSLTGLARRTNFYRLAAKIKNSLKKADNKTAELRAGAGLLAAEVETLLDQSAGLDLYQPDTVFTQDVYSHFRFNVQRMIGLCARSGVPLLFCLPVDNTRDFSPFKSSNNPALPSTKRLSFNKLLATGTAHADRGEFARAIKTLTGAVEIDSLYAEAHFRLGRVLLVTGDTAAAEKHLLLARELDVCPLRAPDRIRHILEEETAGGKARLLDLPELLRVLEPGVLIGNELLLDHIHPSPRTNLTIAVEIARRLAEMIPEVNPAGLDKLDRDALYDKRMVELSADYLELGPLNLAKVLVWAGKYPEVRRMLGANPALLERNGEARYLMGVVQEKGGDFESAAGYYAGALKLLSGHRNSLTFLARLYGQTEQPERAENLYRRALGLYPDDISLLCNYGILLANQGLFDRAMDCFDRALKVNSNSTSVLNNIGLLLLMNKEPDEAFTYFERSLAIMPGDPQANNYSGLIYLLRGNYQQSEKRLLLALRANPEDPSVRTNIGNLYRRTNRLAEAEEQFKLALLLDQSKPDHFLNLALIYRDQGNGSRLIDVLREGLKKFPEDHRLIQLLQR